MKNLNAIKVLKESIFSNNINILFCDMQEKFLPRVYKYEHIKNTAENLAECSKILGFNQIITEHKKDVFGPTINEILKHSSLNSKIYEKTRFAMLDKAQINNTKGIFVLVGIEAHICITQTAIEILENDRELIVLSDAISSISQGERNIALSNLSKMGAYVTTTQSFLFLLLQDAKNEKFKQLLPNIKKFSQANDLLNETFI